jgi:hypothetical protein
VSLTAKQKRRRAREDARVAQAFDRAVGATWDAVRVSVHAEPGSSERRPIHMHKAPDYPRRMVHVDSIAPDLLSAFLAQPVDLTRTTLEFESVAMAVDVNGRQIRWWNWRPVGHVGREAWAEVEASRHASSYLRRMLSAYKHGGEREMLSVAAEAMRYVEAAR